MGRRGANHANTNTASCATCCLARLLWAADGGREACPALCFAGRKALRGKSESQSISSDTNFASACGPSIGPAAAEWARPTDNR